MLTRYNTNRHNQNNLHVASKYIIEDPELDVLNGSLITMHLAI